MDYITSLWSYDISDNVLSEICETAEATEFKEENNTSSTTVTTISDLTAALNPSSTIAAKTTVTKTVDDKECFYSYYHDSSDDEVSDFAAGLDPACADIEPHVPRDIMALREDVLYFEYYFRTVWQSQPFSESEDLLYNMDNHRYIHHLPIEQEHWAAVENERDYLTRVAEYNIVS